MGSGTLARSPAKVSKDHKQLAPLLNTKKWIDELSTMNIWKSYIWTADKDMNMKAIFAVMNTSWAEVKVKPEKKNSGLHRIWTHDLCDT